MKTTETQGSLTRRTFLSTTAKTAAAFSVLPRHVLGGAGFVAPSDKINVAIVGCGGQGLSNVRELFQFPDVQIMAIADPIESYSLEAYYYQGRAGRKPVKAEIEQHYSSKIPDYRCAEYEDFRQMLAKEKAIDAILCATPDHQHAQVCVTAMQVGKHVYCEKPLAHNVWEARLMAKVAKEAKVATQLGNQGHSGDGIRQTCEWIWAGAIGQVREVHAWTNATRWNRKYSAGRPPEEPLPAGVNWDLWIGPREMRPYNSSYTPVSWRDYWAFGTAPLGDFFCHNFDPAVWALDLSAPLSVEAYGAGGVDSEMTPVGGIYTYLFGPTDKRPAIKAVWYDGGLMPSRPEGLDELDRLGEDGNGTLFIGDKGMITCAGWAGAPRLLPRSKMKGFTRPAKTLPRSKGHHRDWLDAIKGGPEASSNFAYGARLTEIGLLGLVAMRTGKKLTWDAEAMKATNAPQADAFIKESYRKGWEIG